MSDKLAVDLLSAYSGKLDTAAGIGKQDGKISEKDLHAIASDGAQPIELRQAANKALKDESFRDQIRDSAQS